LDKQTQLWLFVYCTNSKAEAVTTAIALLADEISSSLSAETFLPALRQWLQFRSV
jgi:hypothetical protein